MHEHLVQELTALIEQRMRTERIPGLAVAIMRDGSYIYEGAFGVVDLASGQSVTPHTLFHLASVTKLFVVTAVMQLVERQHVNLAVPVTRYVPYFRLADPRYTQITVLHLLTHTSGMPDEEDYAWDRPEYDDGALERYVQRLQQRPLLTEPGERFAYSNIAFEVLGALIAQVSGMSFESYVQRHILQPLNMRHSTLLIQQADRELLATPHVIDQDDRVAVSPIFPYHRAHGPSSTMYANVIDLSRFAAAQLNRGTLAGTRILEPAAYDLLWQPTGATEDERWPEIGLTWFLERRPGYLLVGHDGEDTGFTSSLALALEPRVSVVVLSNFDRTRIEDLRDALLEVVIPRVEPNAAQGSAASGVHIA